MKRISILVSGKVQGVFFRASTEKIAAQIGVDGFVRNTTDRKVYIEAQGTEAQLQQLAEWCKHGPERAIVENIVITNIPIKNDEGFCIVKTS